MCGIAGVARLGTEGSADGPATARMLAAMTHRGPDDADTWVGPDVALGACRLAIVDVGGSRQPIRSPDGRYTLVLNGEIYNFRALRAELAAAGVASGTAGDAETVLLAFQHWGERYLDHVEGMFAFALWDAAERRLRLARDRFGEKPLYYAWDGAVLAFASEAKALLAVGHGRREPDVAALHHYLSYRAVPAPFCLFSGIAMLAPGTQLVLDSAGLTTAPYYRLRHDSGLPERSDVDWVESLQAGLRRAVHSRLESDVPLGALLSGGLDSTAVVALMAEVARPRTFFVAFDAGERTQIDRRYARLAADRLGTEHEELELTSRALLDELPRILWHLESPSVDGYQYYYAYALARSRVTVVLSGQGGDELFAGYGWFRQIESMERWRRRRQSLLAGAASRHGARLVATTLHRLGKSRSASNLAELLAGTSAVDSFWAVKHLLSQADKDDLYTPAFRERLSGTPTSRALLSPLETELAGWPVTEAVSFLQIATDLGDILLRDTDAVSMAHSLEVRLPLLDHHLVELALAIPSRLKSSGGEGKQVLGAALRGIVPDEVIERPKLGFSFPMAAWLRGPLRPLADAAFDAETVRRRGYFRPEAMRRYYRLFYEGRGSRSPFYVWCFSMLELWHRIFVDAAATSPPASLADLGIGARRVAAS